MAPPVNYEPTPEEIRKACERIQREWSDYERHRRARLQYGAAVEIKQLRLSLED